MIVNGSMNPVYELRDVGSCEPLVFFYCLCYMDCIKFHIINFNRLCEPDGYLSTYSFSGPTQPPTICSHVQYTGFFCSQTAQTIIQTIRYMYSIQDSSVVRQYKLLCKQSGTCTCLKGLQFLSPHQLSCEGI